MNMKNKRINTLAITVLIVVNTLYAQIEEIPLSTTSDSGIVSAVDSLILDNAIDEAADAVEAAVDAVTDEAVVEEIGSTRSLGVRGEAIEIKIAEGDTIPLYEEGYGGLAKLDDKVADYKVFITGENHTYTESNARLWLKMIKYLNENAGVRNIMFEYGYSYGYLVNEYLKTGDTSLINSIDQFAYMEYSDVIRELKVYNDSLPADRKLYFAAIDIERGAYPIAKNLAYLLPATSSGASDSIQLHVRSVRSLANYNDFKLDQLDEDNRKTSRGFVFKTNATLQLVQTNFVKFESDYKDYLGENFDLFKAAIVDRFNARKKWYEYDNSGAIQQYIYREQYMHRTFLTEAENHPGGWFGQFGRCHTSKEEVTSNSCEWFVFNSLTDQIEHTAGGAYEGKVLSMAIAYNTDRDFGKKYEAGEEALSPYFDELEDNRIALIDMALDTALSKIYGNDFDYILFNSYEERGEAYEYLNNINDYAMDDDPEVYFSVGLGALSIDMDGLNTIFNLSNATGSFTENLNYWDLSLGVASDGAYSATQVGFYRGQNREVTRSSDGALLDYKLTGFFLKSMGGVDILKNAKWIDVVPLLGVVYQKLAVNVKEPSVATNLENGYFSTFKNTEYTNDAFVLEGAGLLRFNLGPVSLGTQVGYQFDLSKKIWKSGKEKLDNGPETSFTGLYTTFRVGLNF
jgi:hypothetical protein